MPKLVFSRGYENIFSGLARLRSPTPYHYRCLQPGLAGLSVYQQNKKKPSRLRHSTERYFLTIKTVFQSILSSDDTSIEQNDNNGDNITYQARETTSPTRPRTAPANGIKADGSPAGSNSESFPKTHAPVL